jgi:hypothetical protein
VRVAEVVGSAWPAPECESAGGTILVVVQARLAREIVNQILTA